MYLTLRLYDRFNSRNVSLITSPLTLVSKAESVENDGDWFTSSSQGFNVESSMMSNPKI